MKRLSVLVLSTALLFGSSLAFAQDKAAGLPTTVSTALDAELSKMEKGLVGLADAMPEDKYNFRPTAGKFDGVMDFAGQVKHVAEGIGMYGAVILGDKKPPAEPASLKTKAELIEYLKSNFAYAHKALASLNEQNMFVPIDPPFGKNKTTRFAMAVALVSHPNDHYGQMVEYLRGAGQVPPGSK